MSVFVSHSTVNEVTVKEVVRILENAKLNTWYDNELGGGDIWWEQILLNIRQCKVFVFVVSEASVRSAPCLAEVEYAKALNRTIIPVQIQRLGRGSPNPVAAIQMVPMTRIDQDSSIALVSAIYQAQLGARPLPERLPRPPAIPYGYLQDFLSQIEQNHLSPDAQVLALNMLRSNFEDEVNPQARDRIANAMLKLSPKPWATNQTIRNVEGIVGAKSRAEYLKRAERADRGSGENHIPRRAAGADGVRIVGWIMAGGGVLLLLLGISSHLGALLVLGPLLLIVGILMAGSRPR